MSTTLVVFGIITWCLIFIAMTVFFFICIVIYRCRREMQNISALLIYNTCTGALLTCMAMCIMVASDLTTGFLISNLGFCYAWGLLYDVSECSIYYSYCLQAIYRLFRVVFYQKKSLILYSSYSVVIIGQWLLILALLLPPIPLKWYTRLPIEKYCLIPYSNVGAEVYHIAILYIIPLVCISMTYLWIIVFIYYTSRASIIVLGAVQRQRNLRDLTVVKRIVILLLALVLLRFPTVIFMIYGIIVGHLPSINLQLGWLDYLSVFNTYRMHDHLYNTALEKELCCCLHPTSQSSIPAEIITEGLANTSGSRREYCLTKPANFFQASVFVLESLYDK